MKIKEVVSRSLILGGALCLCGAIGLADTIKLKNGSVFKGKVVTLKGGEFTIVLDLGSSSRRSSSRMIIAVEDVESIEFDGSEAGSVSAAGTPESSAPATEPAAAPAERRAADPPVERVTTRDTTPTPAPAAEATEGGAPASGSAIAEKTVSVGASSDWTSTEIRVQRGQRISVSASGEVDLGNNRRTGPNGTSINDSRKLVPTRPTGGLIAVVGDDNDDFVYIGKSADFTANHNGILFLSVNEGNLKDNNGAFVARVKVQPPK